MQKIYASEALRSLEVRLKIVSDLVQTLTIDDPTKISNQKPSLEKERKHERTKLPRTVQKSY